MNLLAAGLAKDSYYDGHHNIDNNAFTLNIRDNAANIKDRLDQLQAASGIITGITLTDKTTPTLSLTAAHVTGDLGVLNAITSPYLLSVKDTVANLNGLALGGLHTGQIEIMPTSVIATLTENTQVANLNLSLINLTGDSITEKVYHSTGTEVDFVAANNTVLHKLYFTHDTEAQLHLLGIGSTVVHVL